MVKHVNIFLIIIIQILIVGCSNEPINYQKFLTEKNGVYYTNNTNEPYSGPIFSIYENGKMKEEGTYKKGKRNGYFTFWYENKIKKKSGSYRDGELFGKWLYWNEDGEIYLEENFKDGKKDGLFILYENGQKIREETYNQGRKD